MTLKRSKHKFLLSSESINDRGFRVRTEGIDLEAFKKNPLLLWAHDDKDYLPLGQWEEIEVIDGKVYAYPAFDLSDPFAEKVYKKVENGTIRMASAGLIAREWEEVNGEKWLWTSAMAEGSILTRGSNPEALSSVALFTEDKELITLSSEYFDTILKKDMKTIQLSASVVGLIGLAADAKPEDVQAKIDEIVQLAATQKTQLEQLTSAKATVDSELVTLKSAKSALDTKVKELEEAQVGDFLKLCAVQGKITEGEIPKYKVLLQSSDEAVVTATKSELEAMDSHEPLHKKPTEKQTEELQKLSAMTFSELHREGKLERLKALDLATFNEKWKEGTGNEYTEKK